MGRRRGETGSGCRGIGNGMSRRESGSRIGRELLLGEEGRDCDCGELGSGRGGGESVRECVIGP